MTINGTEILARISGGVIVPYDQTPDAFSFTDVTNADLGTDQISGWVTISGIDNTTAISVSGGEYRIRGAGDERWRTEPFTIVNGNEVSLKHTSSGINLTDTNTILTIGGVSDTFTSTTLAVVSGFDITAADSRNITSLPAYIDLSVSNYVDNYSFAGTGSTVTHSIGTSWDGSNTIRYTPSTLGGAYVKPVSLLYFDTLPATLYMRFCIKYSTGLDPLIDSNGGWKQVIVHTKATSDSIGNGSGRMINNWGTASDPTYGTYMRSFAASWGTNNMTGAQESASPNMLIGLQDGDTSPGYAEAEAGVYDVIGEWACLEYMIDMSVTPNRTELYVTLRDGTSYAEADPFSIGTEGAPAEDQVDYLEFIGMLSNNGFVNGSGDIDISDVRFDTSYIGPPTGFII